jgi:hypothetical protein
MAAKPRITNLAERVATLHGHLLAHEQAIAEAAQADAQARADRATAAHATLLAEAHAAATAPTL